MVQLSKAIKDKISYIKQFSTLPISKPAFCNSQITHNGRQGNLDRAQFIFDNMRNRSVISWTALITAYAENGKLSKARKVFDEMPERNHITWNAMISAYAHASNILEAFHLFSIMPCKDLVSYSTMISGFSKKGLMREATSVFQEMPAMWRDPVGSNALINGYLKIGDMDEAVRIFRRMSIKDVFTWSSMVDGYCKCGRIHEALEIFKSMPDRNVVSWTSMILGLMKNGNFDVGFSLFLQMIRECVKANSTTLSVVLSACIEFSRYEEGLQIHCILLKSGFEHYVFLENSIIVMYSKQGCLYDARRCFNDMSRRDVVSWNSIINGYVEHNKLEEAIVLFEAMPEKDQVSCTTMLTGFANQGLISESVQLFEEMPEKDDIAWTAVISGFVRNGETDAAFNWFNRMMKTGIKLPSLALSSVLRGLANSSLLDQGLQLHALIIKLDLEYNVMIQTSLVSLYAKCGDVHIAHDIFACIREPNMISLNAMITGFAQHGFAKEALELFKSAESDEYFKPNQVTFLGILSACSYAGLVNEGCRYFDSMKSHYGICPSLDHYTCMVHLLGRVGLLDEAKYLIDSMPFLPNSSIWGALLDASRLHLNVSVAKFAAERIHELNPEDEVAIAVLSNMNQEAGLKESVDIKKTPGCSWFMTSTFSGDSTFNGIDIENI